MEQLAKNLGLFLIIAVPMTILATELFEIDISAAQYFTVLVPYVVASAISDRVFPNPYSNKKENENV